MVDGSSFGIDHPPSAANALTDPEESIGAAHSGWRYSDVCEAPGHGDARRRECAFPFRKAPCMDFFYFRHGDFCEAWSDGCEGPFQPRSSMPVICLNDDGMDSFFQTDDFTVGNRYTGKPHSCGNIHAGDAVAYTHDPAAAIADQADEKRSGFRLVFTQVLEVDGGTEFRP